MSNRLVSAFRPIFRLLVAGLLISIFSCNLPSSISTTTVSGDVTELPGETTGLPELTSSSAGSEFSYQPGVGSRIAWIDRSYVVFVPTGSFLMGEDETTPADHSPQHAVLLDGFWIHQTEVTNAQYALCVSAGICEVPYRNTGLPYWYASPVHALDPVVGINWHQAVTYCEWIEGRLPTEAEWEKAARGVEADPYPWGKEPEPKCDLLNYSGCQEIDQPVKVQSFFDGRSPFELADVAGNVLEWVQDWYREDYYSASPSSSPSGPAFGTKRVVRSSSYKTDGDDLVIFLRDRIDPDEHRGDLGFRCVLTGETVGDPPPPICEAVPYIPSLPEGEITIPYPPRYSVNTFCMPDPVTGLSQGYVTLVFSDAITCGYGYTSSAGWLGITSPDEYTVGLSGPGVPIGSTFTIEVCPEMADLPLVEPVCPDDYYYDEDDRICRYGAPEMHDTPGSCDTDELFIPGYGCLQAREETGPVLMLCPGGYDHYEHYESIDPPGLYTLCVPVDGPEECLTDPFCSANNMCPEGFSYVTDSDCCELPPDVHLFCPPLYTLKLSEDPMCLPPELSPLCSSFTAHIPSCDTPTVTVPPPACVNPERYGDKDSCEAALCKWTLGPTQKWYCTYP